jgi:hypothetical protein
MELPDVPLVTMKFDPLTVLRLNSVEPLKAELAHETALPAAGADEAAEDSKSDSSDTGDEKAKKKASKGKGASSKKKEWELPRSGGF